MNNSRSTEGQNRADEMTRRLRKDLKNAGSPMGYDLGGTTRQVAGDEDGPFSRTPPFPKLRATLIEGEVPFGGAYLFSGAQDIADIRILSLWVEYRAGVANSVLSIIPEVRGSGTEDFVTIGVVDGAITPVSAAGFTTTFASRTFYPTELRTPAAGVGSVLRTVLQLAVGPYAQIRFGVSDLTGADGQLVLDGSVSG